MAEEGVSSSGGVNVAGHKISYPIIILGLGGAVVVVILLRGGGGGANAPTVYTSSGGAGPAGAAGASGASAYELAQQQGFTGSLQEWLASLQGTPGQNADPSAILAALNAELNAYLNGVNLGYTVQAGDTWETIAARFHTTVAILKNLNKHVARPNPGQSIFVPAPTFH